MLGQRTAPKTAQKMGRGCGILFGLGWTAFSSIFVVAGLVIFWSEMKFHAWDEVPCEIHHFRIVDLAQEDPPFQVELEYSYRVDGRDFGGKQFTPDFEGSDDYAELVGMEEEFRSTNSPVCWVNPDDPADSVLLPGGRAGWFGLIFLAFGGGFVLIGIGLLVSAIRADRSNKALTGNAGQSGLPDGLLGAGFFGVFALAGIGMLVGLVLPTAIDYLKAKRWTEVRAEIIWAKVREESGEDGPTYRADIFYRYEFEGREYRSNSVALQTGSSSGRSSKQEKVAAHPAGAEVDCYVNPNKPTEALLDRGLGWWALFGLFPLPFAAIGLGGLYQMFRKQSGPKVGRQPVTGTVASKPRNDDVSRSHHKQGSVVRKRWLDVLGALLIAAFWNGIVSLFFWQVWEGWKTGDGSWFLTLFLTPFVVIGVGLIVHFLYRILAVFSPVYRVKLGQSVLEPGQQTSFSWRRSGGSGNPRHFSVWLIGREEATYRRGTRTTTSTALFYESNLFETKVRRILPSGRCQVDLPADAVATFDGDHNKLQWFVVLKADVPGRPDVRDEYEIVVRSTKGGNR